jgi:hypothetical protein
MAPCALGDALKERKPIIGLGKIRALGFWSAKRRQKAF